MTERPKGLVELDSTEAMEYMLQSDQYHNFELPEYFNFSKILEYVSDKIGDRDYSECRGDGDVTQMKDVNLNVLTNKDGKYGVRPIMLCNPYMYYFLVKEIFSPGAWDIVKEHFNACSIPNINVSSMPVVRQENESFHNSTAILNWWNNMEQKSLELSLEYRYMFVSDITNCYGSINPQTIAWALDRKGTSKESSQQTGIAGRLIRILSDMQQGKNIGIPQGSTVFDIIAEIILAYADLRLHEEVERRKIDCGFEILRYRDDYRIFCNDRDKLEEISYILQSVLEDLNFRMNVGKTKVSSSVVLDSIKPDKLYYIANTPITAKRGTLCDFDGLQKHLLYILQFGKKFPNSGQLKNMLTDFDTRVKDALSPKVVIVKKKGEDGQELEVEMTRPGYIGENITAMSAVGAQIAEDNVTVLNYVLRSLSRMLAYMETKNPEQSLKVRNLIVDKLLSLPNSDFNQIWLQNLTYSNDYVSNLVNRYSLKLCRVVMGLDEQVWDNSWLKDEFAAEFPVKSIVDRDILASVTNVVEFKQKNPYYGGVIPDMDIDGADEL